MSAKLKTYEKLKESGKISELEFEILKHLKYCNYTIKALSLILKHEKSTITARMSELEDKGLVEIEREVKNKYDHWESIFKLSDITDREKLSQRRELGKIRRSIKFLRENGYRVRKKYKTQTEKI